MIKDTPSKLSHTTLILHWLIGITMIALLGTGVYMAENSVYGLFPWHKSFGFLILFIVILRVYWRIKNGWPKPASQYSSIEIKLSKIVHWTLILGTLIMPISGIVMSSMGGHGIYLFELEIIAKNVNPENINRVLAHNKEISSIGKAIHHWTGYIMIAAIVLHVVGAIKHHVVDKDNTLKRMLGKV